MMESDAVGGGPVESFIRVVTQRNMVTDLETGIVTTIVEQSDQLRDRRRIGQSP